MRQKWIIVLDSTRKMSATFFCQLTENIKGKWCLVAGANFGFEGENENVWPVTGTQTQLFNSKKK